MAQLTSGNGDCGLASPFLLHITCYKEQQERCPWHCPNGGEDEQLQMHDLSEGKIKTERQCSYNEQPHQQSLRKNMWLWENV